MWCGFFDPHAAYAACRPFSEMYDPSTLPLPASWQHIDDPCEALRQCREHEPYTTQLTTGRVRETTLQIYGMVTHIDVGIGRVIAKIKDTGQYDNTVIVFMNHGDYMSAHHLLYKGDWPWEEVVRVPTVLEYSGIRAEPIHQLLEELVWTDPLDMPRPCGS